MAGSIVLHDYWEAGTIVFLFTIAEWLESRASHKVCEFSSLFNFLTQEMESVHIYIYIYLTVYFPRMTVMLCFFIYLLGLQKSEHLIW